MKQINFSRDEIFFDYNNELCNNGRWVNEKHLHNLYEIYFLESGKCDYFIDGKIYNMQPGDVALIKENIIHNTVYNETVCSRFLLNCPESALPESTEDTFPKSLIFRNGEKTQDIRTIFSKIQYEYENKSIFSDEIIFCYAKLLFLTIAGSENTYSEKPIHKYTEKAAEYIKENITTDISLEKVAKNLSISAEHLSRQFKKDTGLNFSEYVNLLRFKKAESLLLNKENLSITEVAYMCGFNDSNYFSTRFKKLYGVSPRKWRYLKR